MSSTTVSITFERADVQELAQDLQELVDELRQRPVLLALLLYILRQTQ